MSIQEGKSLQLTEGRCWEQRTRLMQLCCFGVFLQSSLSTKLISPLSVYCCYDVIVEMKSVCFITAMEDFRVRQQQVFEVTTTTMGSGEQEAWQACSCRACFLSACFSIILFPFLQRTFPRVVQQRLWTSVCSRSCQDQKLISASDCWGTRNKNLRKCSWERVSISRGLAGNRNLKNLI